MREREFLELVRRHRVQLVCWAHALLFDQHVHEGTHFVVSGGGGTGLCSRGALFHAVQITVGERGEVGGRVLQAFGGVRLSFGDPA